MFVNKHLIYLWCAYFTKLTVLPSAYYFNLKTKISEDFHIRISVTSILMYDAIIFNARVRSSTLKTFMKFGGTCVKF